MKTTKEFAYAKINLTLDVVGKRADGFHNIESIMHSLSLADELTLSLSPSDKTEISLSIIGNDALPTDHTNLVCKAATLYLEKVGQTAKIDMTLVKRIPSAAGLGGGSSDGAATLRALNALYGNRLTKAELLSLAAKLGSDVPYCLVGGTRLCSGRGEIMTEINTAAKGVFVVAIGEDSVSTPKAYRELDRIYSDFEQTAPCGKGKTEEMRSSLLSGEISHSAFYNIFEEAVMPDCPSVSNIKSIMTSAGALGTLMSGSGPSVFGLYGTVAEAENAAKILSESGYRAFIAESL